MKGKIVLSVAFIPEGMSSDHRYYLESLHKYKIELADEVLVINRLGYIGESTRMQIEYAMVHEKKIIYLEPLKEK